MARYSSTLGLFFTRSSSRCTWKQLLVGGVELLEQLHGLLLVLEENE